MAYLCIGGTHSRRISRRESKRQRRRHDEIELELAQASFEEQKSIKFLLLGSAEGGKSTILKQMKLIHNQLTDVDYANVKRIVYANTIDSMGIILVNMIKMGIPFENSERELDRAAVFDVIDNDEQGNRFTDDVYEGLQSLWRDRGVQECFEQRYRYYLLDSAKYFLDNLARIYSSHYTPTTQDLLYARQQTTGIVHIEIPVVAGNVKCTLRVFDVGGQRTERRKWIHCFDNVDCVIFITAISEFDQKMAEDNNANRMQDSLALFQNTTSSDYFCNAYIILFLNKIDLFRQKIESNISITELFPDYKGGQTYDESLGYVKNQFAERKPEGKVIYTHPTCATDSNQAQKVITNCTDMVFKNVLNTLLK